MIFIDHLMSKKLRRLYFKAQTHQYWLDLMNQSPYVHEKHDGYNKGLLIDKLEYRVAKLLDKEKALFFHKGVAAQLVALKVAAVASNNNAVILHPNSHIAVNEHNAYQEIMGLIGIKLGAMNNPFNFEDVVQAAEAAGSLCVELPLRRAGFKLTPWDELVKMQLWANQNSIHFHMDGARLWESTHYYQKSLAEIADLFDSVYVSFYKGLGGLSGAALAGDAEFIEQCKVWRSRMAGDMYSAFPMLITALEGLDNHLEKIPSWVKRAQVIAKLLNDMEEIQVEKPQTNGFLIFIKADLKKLNEQLEVLKEKMGMALTHQFMATENPNIQKAELQIAGASEEISNQEVVDYFKTLIAHSI
jgi:threonine aldolase